MSDDVVRAFIAIEIEDSVRVALGEMQSRLRETGANVSWVSSENMHLTLVFLGDVMAERVTELGALLDRAAWAYAPFTSEVEGIGYFGPAKSPRIIWAGMSDSSGALASLQRDTADVVSALGYELEQRKFKPHLTIGRVRSNRKVEGLTSALRSAKNVRFGSTGIKRLLLMRSHLAPHGVRYAILHESALKGAG